MRRRIDFSTRGRASLLSPSGVPASHRPTSKPLPSLASLHFPNPLAVFEAHIAALDEAEVSVLTRTMGTASARDAEPTEVTVATYSSFRRRSDLEVLRADLRDDGVESLACLVDKLGAVGELHQRVLFFFGSEVQ